MATVDKLAILKLDGNFEQGFSVTLQIGLDGDRPSLEITGTLPPNPDIPQHYNRWRSLYNPKQPMIKVVSAQVKNFSISDLNQAAQILSSSLNDWLESSPFRPIRERLFEQLNPDDSIRAIVQTPDIQLRRLPWHFWDFFSRYPKAEVALSMPAYSRVERSASLRKQVRILAILGDDRSIDVSADRQFLENLPDAETVFLVKPTRRDFGKYLWDEEGWDILFFAGHSKTIGETGQFSINEHDELKIGDLKYALKEAIARGLHLAIFNSCDGLGLVPPQIDLQIPQIVVMREPVPNFVAQEFLKNFLATFAVNGKSLYASVREAREKLQVLEDKFPCATWLPTICQNPAVKPLTWQELLGKTDKQIPTSADETWKCVRTLAEHKRVVKSVAISPDGQIIASGSRDKTIKLWNLNSGKLLRTITGHESAINWVAFSPDNKTLASASVSSPIKLWDWQTGELLGTLKEKTWIPLIFLSPECGAFSPDGRILASGYSDDTIKLWDWQAKNLLNTLRAHTSIVSSVAIEKDLGQTLVSCSRDNTIKIWNLRTGDLINSLNWISGFLGMVVCVTKEFVKEISNFSIKEISNFENVHGLCAIALSPDGKTIASGGDNPQINLWHLDSGELLGTLTGHSGDIYSIAFSPDGQTLASGSNDKTIKIWNWRNQEMLLTLGQHSDIVYCLAFSPDGQTLVSGSVDKTIKIWRVS